MKKTMNAVLVALIAVALIAGVTASFTQAAGKPGTPGGKPVTCIATCDNGLLWICCPVFKMVNHEWTQVDWDCYWGAECGL